MTFKREWIAQNGGIMVKFECPFYDDLLPSRNDFGRLTQDFECHALWNYYGLAKLALARAKANLVDESELSLVFNQNTARQLFISIAKTHNVLPEKMIKFWDVVQRQRLALGGGDDLPAEFQFRYWGH